MDGFMVLLACGMDGIPIRLVATVEEARELVEQIREQREDGQIIQDAIGDWFTDASVVLAVSIVQFHGGRVFDIEHVIEFEEMEEST